MRRREKFVLAAILLSVGILGLQYIPLSFRYVATAIFGVVTYVVSAWALSEDLQPFEWMTILPMPALYAMSVGLFYFLLPQNLFSRVAILVLFGVGMYALYLTSNIFSVAKGRTIQLVHAARAVGLLFTLLTSLLFLNTIFSARMPWIAVGALVALSHYPLVYVALWSVQLDQEVKREEVVLSGLLTLVLAEMAVVLTFFPFSVWNAALLIMSVLYIGVGIMQSHLEGRLFDNITREYSVVALLLGIIFLILLPWR